MCSSYEDSPNDLKWTRCTYPKGTDVKYPKWEVVQYSGQCNNIIILF